MCFIVAIPTKCNKVLYVILCLGTTHTFIVDMMNINSFCTTGEARYKILLSIVVVLHIDSYMFLHARTLRAITITKSIQSAVSPFSIIYNLKYKKTLIYIRIQGTYMSYCHAYLFTPKRWKDYFGLNERI